MEINCNGCVAKSGQYVNRPSHRYADCRGWVLLCQILRDEGNCRVDLARKMIQIRLLELGRQPVIKREIEG